MTATATLGTDVSLNWLILDEFGRLRPSRFLPEEKEPRLLPSRVDLQRVRTLVAEPFLRPDGRPSGLRYRGVTGGRSRVGLTGTTTGAVSPWLPCPGASRRRERGRARSWIPGRRRVDEHEVGQAGPPNGHAGGPRESRSARNLRRGEWMEGRSKPAEPTDRLADYRRRLSQRAVSSE